MNSFSPFVHNKIGDVFMMISLIRTLLLYIVIIAAVRLMGKRQISELQTSELVVTLLISDIAAIPMQDTGQPLASGFIPIAVLAICEVGVSFIMMKSGKFREMICGKPIIVIRDGKIQPQEMHRLRMTTEDLFEAIRQKNVFHISDVSYAIVETNGKMSILKKPEQEMPTAGALGVAQTDSGFETVVISDGVINDSSLNLCNKNRTWLQNILKSKQLQPKDIFIMTADTSGNYQIIQKGGKV
jgi:uncharacterized membrane protein YcaP (DUF421 family)